MPTCPKCGYELSELDSSCPRCSEYGAAAAESPPSATTSALSDSERARRRQWRGVWRQLRRSWIAGVVGLWYLWQAVWVAYSAVTQTPLQMARRGYRRGHIVLPGWCDGSVSYEAFSGSWWIYAILGFGVTAVCVGVIVHEVLATMAAERQAEEWDARHPQ